MIERVSEMRAQPNVDTKDVKKVITFGKNVQGVVVFMVLISTQNTSSFLGSCFSLYLFVYVVMSFF
jgi:hypothetical protein